jgi:hypothetical protein
VDRIPVSIEWENKIYSGHFSEVHGSGANVWHLMIGGYFYGQLTLMENYRWVFHGNKLGEKFKGHTNYFEDMMLAWYQ